MGQKREAPIYSSLFPSRHTAWVWNPGQRGWRGVGRMLQKEGFSFSPRPERVTYVAEST